MEKKIFLAMFLFNPISFERKNATRASVQFVLLSHEPFLRYHPINFSLKFLLVSSFTKEVQKKNFEFLNLMSSERDKCGEIDDGFKQSSFPLFSRNFSKSSFVPGTPFRILVSKNVSTFYQIFIFRTLRSNEKG